MNRLRSARQPHSLFPRISKLVAASVAAMIGVAAPAHAGSVEDERFLAALDKARISFHSPERAVAAGEAVCQLMDEGKTATEVVWQLVTNNPGLTNDTAAKFTGIAVSVYCPQHLQNTGG